MHSKPTSILGSLAIASFVALGLTACGAGNALTTGTLLGGGGSASSGPKPLTASDRAVYVGATVARAQRCGFIFEPEQLRASYLASEQQAGTPAEAVQRVTKEFDYTRQTILAAASKDDAYCTEGRTRETKAALSRQLAGDFSPPQKRPEIDVKWSDHQRQADKPFDGQKVFDASSKRIGPRDE